MLFAIIKARYDTMKSRNLILLAIFSLFIGIINFVSFYTLGIRIENNNGFDIDYFMYYSSIIFVLISFVFSIFIIRLGLKKQRMTKIFTLIIAITNFLLGMAFISTLIYVIFH